MLRITLYGNCCLNNKYQVEFSHKVRQAYTLSYFERYLQTKPKITFDIDMAYYENSGVLNFDLELIQNISIYTYNYMKIQFLDEEENIKLIRYCFISDIEVKNDVVYLSYEEDIYNSYIDDITGCLPSFMSRKRINALGWSPTCHLPVDYDGNNPLIYEPIENLNNEYCVIAEIQKYSVSQSGEQTSRESSYCFIDNYNHTSQVTTRFDTLYNRLNDIKTVAFMAQNKCIKLGSSEYEYFEIANIHLVPKAYLNNIQNLGINLFGDIYFIAGQSEYIVYKCYSIITNDVVERTTYSIDLQNDFKRIKIGTFNQNFDIINNGTILPLDIKIKASTWSFGIYLILGESIIEITDSFKVDIPYSYLNGEILTQQKMQREMRTINGIVKIGSGIAQTALDIASYGGASGISMFGTSGQKITTKIKSKTKSGNTKWRSVSKNVPGKASALDMSSDAITGIGKTATGITDLIETNAPIYSSSKGIFSDIHNLFSIKEGLLNIKINPDNEDFVKQITNETGLIVYSIVNSNNIDGIFQDYSMEYQYSYDVVKFDSCNLYGKFPENIADKLNEIFESGVKIIYDATETPVDRYFEDNYV